MLNFSYVTDTLSHNNNYLEFVRPQDPQEILDSMSNEDYEKDKMLPYWSELWPASIALYNFLCCSHKSLIPSNGYILEIGCGLGIGAAFLCKHGYNCFATDISFDACKFSKHNISLYSIFSKVFCSDWRDISIKSGISCIIASDIIYEQRWVIPVINFLKYTLIRNGFALISDPCRQFWNTFKETAVESGFTCDMVCEDFVNEGKTRVEIIKIIKK
jgi:predicted nicotinamide N-methyase